MQLGISYVRETFAAADKWAFVWLVTGVCSPVDCQSRALNESLVARLIVASIRAFISVYSVMPLEV